MKLLSRVHNCFSPCGMFKFYFIIYIAASLSETKYSYANIENLTMGVNIMDASQPIYYNPKTNSALPFESMDASSIRLPGSYPVQYISRGLSCSCDNLKCGCCADVKITAIEFNRRACTNVTVVPQEFALDFDLLMDDERVFTNRITARNPPPACVPLYYFPVITFCVRFFDLHLDTDDKFNACIDFETKFAQSPMFVLHFNCAKLGGENGITWVRPSPSANHAVTSIAAAHSETYDHVNFELTNENLGYSHTSTLTPEGEHQIGTLKL